MRKISMTEKRRLTIATILSSKESIGITNRGETIAAILPDWGMVAEFRKGKEKPSHRSRNRTKSRGRGT